MVASTVLIMSSSRFMRLSSSALWLSMALEAIQKIMGRRDFDVLSALERHKAELLKRINRLELLISTVDATILH